MLELAHSATESADPEEWACGNKWNNPWAKVCYHCGTSLPPSYQPLILLAQGWVPPPPGKGSAGYMYNNLHQ
eukprot:8475777-Pyramimonas_sp.AAC.1